MAEQPATSWRSLRGGDQPTWPVRVKLTGHESDKADAMTQLLDKHSIIAGGAVRDLLLGDDPRDIDLFVSPAGFEAAQTRVVEQLGDDVLAIAESLDPRTAQRMHEEARTGSSMSESQEDADYCTMCGRDWCSVRINKEIRDACGKQ